MASSRFRGFGGNDRYVVPARVQADMQVAYVTNAATSSLVMVTTRTSALSTAVAPTNTPPVSVVDSGSAANDIFIVAPGAHLRHKFTFFGTGNDNSVFQAKIWGVEQWLRDGQTEDPLFVYKPLVQINGILGATTGISSGNAGFTTSHRFADVLEKTSDWTDMQSARVRGEDIATLELDKSGAILYRVQLRCGDGVGSACTAIGFAVAPV